MEIIRYQIAPSFEENHENVVGIFAVKGEGIVGSAWGPVNSQTGVAKLDTIEVNADLRGSGIGTGLLNIFKQEAVRFGAKKIWGEIRPELGLKVEKTRNFYAKNGFRVKEDDTFEAEI